MQQGEYDIKTLRVAFSDAVPSTMPRSKGFGHPIKQDFASAFSSTSCPTPSYRQTLTFIFQEQEPKRKGLCPYRAPSSWCSFKLEVVKGHSWLCPCLKASARLVSLKKCCPSSLNHSTHSSIRSTHYTNTHPRRCHWVSSCSYGTALFSEGWAVFFLRLENTLLHFPFFFFLLSIDTDVWTPQRAKSRWDSPSSWVVSNPSGIKMLAISQRGPFMRLFCLPGWPFRPKGLQGVDNATKIGLSQKSLVFLSHFKLLLWWRSEDPKSLSVPLIWYTAMEQSLPIKQDRRGAAPEGLNESLLWGGPGNRFWPNPTFLERWKYLRNSCHYLKMDLICDFSENMLKKVQMFVSTVSYQSVLDLPLKTVAFPLSPLLFKSVFLHLECWENSGNIRKLLPWLNWNIPFPSPPP